MFQHLAPEKIFSLEGRVALITGAAGGIAAGLTQGFAAAGARLVLVDRNEAVETRAQQLQEAGADASASSSTSPMPLPSARRLPIRRLAMDDWISSSTTPASLSASISSN